MTTIEIDLENYADEIRYTFCENNNCLLNSARRDFKEKFSDYVSTLEKKLLIFNEEIKVEDILNKLQEFKGELEQ